jgi:hypothetical protein
MKFLQQVQLVPSRSTVACGGQRASLQRDRTSNLGNTNPLSTRHWIRSRAQISSTVHPGTSCHSDRTPDTAHGYPCLDHIPIKIVNTMPTGQFVISGYAFPHRPPGVNQTPPPLLLNVRPPAHLGTRLPYLSASRSATWKASAVCNPALPARHAAQQSTVSTVRSYLAPSPSPTQFWHDQCRAR